MCAAKLVFFHRSNHLHWLIHWVSVKAERVLAISVIQQYLKPAELLSALQFDMISNINIFCDLLCRAPIAAFHFQCLPAVCQEPSVEREYYFSFSFSQLYGGTSSTCHFLLWWWWWWSFHLWASSQWLPRSLGNLSSLCDWYNPPIPCSISGCVEGTFSLDIQPFADSQSAKRSCALVPDASKTVQTPS